jgi:hypothetical protein
MGVKLLGAVLIALLLPALSLAQCEEEDWVVATSALPNGQMWSSGTSPALLISKTDHSIYLVKEYFNNTEVETLLLNDVLEDVTPCDGGAAIIQKYNSEGLLIWHKYICLSVAGNIDGLAVDSLGNLYVGGFFKGDLLYEDSLVAQALGMGSFNAHFTLKVANNGDIEWVRTGIRSGAVGHVWTDHGLLLLIAVHDSVSFGVNTYYHPNPTNPLTRDFVILMLDSNGDVVWNRHLSGSSNEQIRHVAYSNGKILVSGRFAQDVTYDGQTLTGTDRMFQLALSSEDGQRLWMKKQSNNDGTAVLVYDSEFLDDGTVISVGHYNGSPSIFGFEGQTISSSNGLTDGFIMQQVANTGELLWLKTLGAAGYSSISGITKTSTGVAITGFFDSSELNYEGITLVNHNDETEEPFIIIIDKDGKPQCHIDAIGTEADDRGVKIVHDSNYLYTLISFSDSTAFWDFELEAQGLKDIALWKTCLPCDTLTSIAETTIHPTLHIFPNPANQNIRVEATGNNQQPTAITITDMLGHAVLHLQTEGHEQHIDISSLPIGVYVVAAATARRRDAQAKAGGAALALTPPQTPSPPVQTPQGLRHAPNGPRAGRQTRHWETGHGCRPRPRAAHSASGRHAGRAWAQHCHRQWAGPSPLSPRPAARG